MDEEDDDTDITEMVERAKKFQEHGMRAGLRPDIIAALVLADCIQGRLADIAQRM